VFAIPCDARTAVKRPRSSEGTQVYTTDFPHSGERSCVSCRARSHALRTERLAGQVRVLVGLQVSCVCYRARR
jgi:hypothetical protein